MRIAMIVRGQDVIEDESRLKKILAAELQITPQEYQSAKRLLQELDVLSEKTALGKPVLVEKVQHLDHSANYKRLGESWAVSLVKREPQPGALASRWRHQCWVEF
jgi:hypothetical protein